MAVNAIIIDDEPKLREVLAIKLKQYCPEITIVDQAQNAAEAYQSITKHKPDIIFLDIQMPGETGFDLLNRFEKIDFEIIFVTGFNEFALKALKVSAVDYILKPIQTTDLVDAVEKAITRINQRMLIQRYDVLKHNIDNLDTQEAKIVIPSSSYYQFVGVNEIMYCEGWQRYTRIHLENGEVIVSSYNIGVFRDILKPYAFITTHKSHLVNVTKIVRYTKEGFVVLSNDEQVPVSRRRKDEFLASVESHGIILVNN